ncbi:MAG: hypothetical protein AAFN05_13325 [Pseudomonadota bacterium]
MTSPTIGIVCGLESERQALGPDVLGDNRIAVSVSGARPAAAEDAAAAMARDGVRLLLSWGLAGGLDARHQSGDLVMPRVVVGEAGGQWSTTPVAFEPQDRVPSLSAPTRLVGLESIVFNADEKRSLAVASGASVADMESHRVARAGAAYGVPIVVARAVGDAHDRALPRLAADAIGPSGKPRIGHVLLGLARRPTDLPALVHAAQDSRRAHGALGELATPLVRALLASVSPAR